MAVLYIILSLLTAVIFILTREVCVDIKKRDFLVIKVDLTFFAIELLNREKSKKSGKKKKADIEMYRSVYSRILDLLSGSSIEVVRCCLPIFSPPDSPDKIPKLISNRAVNMALIGYISAHAKSFSLRENALVESLDETDPTVYRLILRTPMIRLIYTLIAIRVDVIKSEKRKKRYVGNKNGRYYKGIYGRH